VKKEGLVLIIFIVLLAPSVLADPPIFTEIPPNITVGLFTNWTIQINATDEHGINTWFTNDTSRFNLSLSGLFKNKINVADGTYHVNVTVVGNLGQRSFFTFSWSVDGTTPSFTEIPQNITLEYYTQAFAIDVNATDSYNISKFYLNDTVRFKINDSGYFENNSFLTVGTYHTLVFVNDTYNNINSLHYRLYINDTIAPVFLHTLPNRSLPSTDNLAIDINATDTHSIFYFVNDSTNFKINGSGYLENNTVLSGGTDYHFLIIANDSSNNKVQFHFNLSVTGSDTTAPTLDHSLPNRSINSITNFALDLNASDASGISTYFINDTSNFKINSSGYLENNTNLSVRAFYLNISINDTSNNVKSYHFLLNITLLDTTAPTLNHNLTNRSITSITSFALNINATDTSGISNYFINDTTNFKINNSGYFENNTNLSVRLYHVNVSINDTSNNVRSYHFALNVTAAVAPTWDQVPVNRTLEYYSASLAIDYNASDVEGISRYYINYTEDFSINQSGFLKNTTDMAIGYYYIKVSVNDTLGLVSSLVLNLSILDTAGPAFTEVPPNRTITLSESIGIQINVTDKSDIDSYSDNDTERFDINDTGYFKNSSAMEERTYYVNISSQDQYSNVNYIIFKVTVENSVTPPTFTQIPQNRTIEYFSENLAIDVNATDSNGISKYYVNDTTRFKVNNSGYLENNTALGVGKFHVKLSVNDTSNNIANLTISTNVNDTTIPSFSQIPKNSTLTFRVNNLTVQINATDASGIGNWSVNSTNKFKINDSGYLTNNSPLSVGIHIVNISINDTYIILITFSLK